MGLDRQTEMADSDIDHLLTSRETAVLSLARDGTPYAIPISYGYDPDSRQFVFRLVSTSGSEKRQFLSGEPRARLVVYVEDDPQYESVVATGQITEIPREELTAGRINQYGEAKRPLFEIWTDDLEDLDIRLYELVPTELTGRRIQLDEE